MCASCPKGTPIVCREGTTNQVNRVPEPSIRECVINNMVGGFPWSPSSANFDRFFFGWEGSGRKIDYRRQKVGTLILTPLKSGGPSSVLLFLMPRFFRSRCRFSFGPSSCQTRLCLRQVYDLSEFMDRHPGGPTTILAWAGKESSFAASRLVWSVAGLVCLFG